MCRDRAAGDPVPGNPEFTAFDRRRPAATQTAGRPRHRLCLRRRRGDLLRSAAAARRRTRCPGQGGPRRCPASSGLQGPAARCQSHPDAGVSSLDHPDWFNGPDRSGGGGNPGHCVAEAVRRTARCGGCRRLPGPFAERRAAPMGAVSCPRGGCGRPAAAAAGFVPERRVARRRLQLPRRSAWQPDSIEGVGDRGCREANRVRGTQWVGEVDSRPSAAAL